MEETADSLEIKNGKATIIFDSRKKEREDLLENYREGNVEERKTSRVSSRPKYEKREPTEEEIASLVGLFKNVVVNDYGDEYHLSEDERKRRNKYYEVFSKLMKCKKKYRKLDEFVKVFRLCMDCLEVVASDNMVYDKADFVSKVLAGKIKVTGLSFPKYMGKDRKEVNWDFVAEVIADRDMDPSVLIKEDDSPLDDMTDDELGEVLFTPEQLSALEKLAENEADNKVTIRAFTGDGTDDEEVIVDSIKDSKRFLKEDPEMYVAIKNSMIAEKKLGMQKLRMSKFLSEITSDDYREIEALDKSRGYMSEDDVPEFDGDIMNKDDYRRYLYQLKEFRETHTRVNYKGKARTIQEVKELELKDFFEESGWNVRALSGKSKRENELKKIRKGEKKERKREEKLKARLESFYKKNDKGEIVFNSSKKKKKKHKKK